MTVALIIIASALLLYLVVLLVIYLIQERLIFAPNLIKKDPSIKLVSSYEDIFLNTKGNGHLHGMLIKADEPKGVILYFHGNTGSLYKWSVLAEELTHFGYDVLPYDYRGYGKSTGKRSEELMHQDALAFYNYAVDRYSNKNVILYGRSLGSGFATRLAAEQNPHKLVLETPYDNFINAADFHFPFIPVKWLLKYEFKNDEYIEQVKCPILILHGTRDRIIPFKLALNLFENISESTENHLVTIPRGRHNNLSSFALFREKLKEFLSVG
ncbi:MAG: alpha/beta fold hydrolase [Flavobacteriales bacterium]|nr:alpha/beta fold hydrolase [Flavobacteriales bacterium]